MKIGIIGCTGRMGTQLLTEVLSHQDCVLSAATARKGNILLGQDVATMLMIAATGIIINSNIDELVQLSDLIIDFTTPETSINCLSIAADHKKPMVIGTTGFTPAQFQLLESTAQQIPILWSANMSVGINLLLKLIKIAASVTGPSYDLEIIETHHRDKVDSPSGTALLMGEAAARGRNLDLANEAIFARHGQLGKRTIGKIGFNAVRGGDVIGDHTLLLAGSGERIELTHKASNRSIYASGAVRAALWLQHQTPGLYSMLDVLA